MQAFYEFLHLIFVFKQCIVIPVAGLAQLVEHLICNQRVVGSSPTTGTRISAGFLRIFVLRILKCNHCIKKRRLALFLCCFHILLRRHKQLYLFLHVSRGLCNDRFRWRRFLSVACQFGIYYAHGATDLFRAFLGPCRMVFLG